MKVKISELRPNPFKKGINHGKLDEDTVGKIQANVKELGLMGSLPVFKKGGEFFLVAGHHRVEALKREFGKDYAVEVTVHDYSEDNVLRGMVIENLTQRDNDFLEEADNLKLIRKYLQKTMRSLGEQMVKRPQGGGQQPEAGSVRDIHAWLHKNASKGDIMSVGKIAEVLGVVDNLDEELLPKVHKAEGKTERGDDVIPVKTAVKLSRIENKDEQKMMAKIIQEQDTGNQEETKKLITVFKSLPDEERKDVLEGRTKLQELSKVVPDAKSSGEMALTFNKRAANLVMEMRTLRKALYQFRREKLFEQFTPKQRSGFKARLSDVKKEYGELVEELETSMEAL